MPHADAALFPSAASKAEAYELAYQQLETLFDEQRNWICNLANAASLLWALFHSRPEPLKRVNWAGFYIRSDLYPSSKSKSDNSTNAAIAATTSRKEQQQQQQQQQQQKQQKQQEPIQLLLAPFAGLPACQAIPLPRKRDGSNGTAVAIRPPGVCAAAFLEDATQIVPDVERRPGHIACDARTRSELVVPLRGGDGSPVGVLDIDCELEDGFDAEDQRALERIADLIGKSCDWD